MPEPIDLEGVIEDSVNDAVTPDETPVDTAPADTDTVVEEPAAETPADGDQAPAPGAEEAVADEFAKRFNIQAQSITGRENRIPYSRVKKIVENAEKTAAEKVRKELEGQSGPKFTELETKVKDYEGRLQKVGEFENLIEHRPQEFLNFLSTLPAYKDFFAHIATLSAPQTTPAAEQSYLDASTMPQPDETLADGSKVYSLAGLAKRDEWLAKQVEARAIKAAEDRIAKRYEPIEAQWQAEQRRQQAIPAIKKQIEAARQWVGFTDNEQEIIEALKADPNLSLDGAYRQVVVPKLTSTRDEQRKSILEELKRKPVSTSAPTTAVKPTQTPAGKRSLEDIIAEAAQSLKR